MTNIPTWLHGVIEESKDKKIILVGHSLGGAIAMTFALEHASNLQAVILAATGARLRVDPKYLSLLEKATRGDFADWIEWMKINYYFLPEEERETLIKKHLEIGPAVYQEHLTRTNLLPIIFTTFRTDRGLCLINWIEQGAEISEVATD